ncbi:MAG TPA: Ig domain-containing protein [Candidatus Acidoferrales bacterium]|nr:Ig domain-containing protein [Candidatus Acidoferrales bacterium]
MFEDSPKASTSRYRRLLRYTWLGVAIVALGIAWIFYVRWQTNRDIDFRAAQKAAAEQRENAARSVELMGGNKFDILNFYAAPGAVRRGDSFQLCYGVSNAASVKLDPPVGSVWPSYNRCFSLTPKKTETYTLTATDSAGHSKSASFTVTVLSH